MRTLLSMICCTFLVVGVATAQADVTYVDGFDGGANPTGWNWNGFNESIPATGGNPDYYLANDDFFAYPKVKSTAGAATPFHGDYAAAGVSAISFDWQNWASPAPSGYGISGGLVLFADDGTYAYTTNATDLMPVTGVWRTTNFVVPSQEASLPAGWNMPAGGTWSDLISDVDRVELWYLDPGYVAGGTSGWSVGMDNASITYVPEPCALVLVSMGGLALLRRRR